MNKKFDSSLYSSNINIKKANTVLKFYQTTVNIKELYNPKNFNVTDLNPYNNYWDIPEGFIFSTSLNNLSVNEKNVFKIIEDFVKNEKNVYLLPIIIINHSTTVPVGVYSLDFINNVIYQYKDFDINVFKNENIEKDFDMCICYFLDLDYSIFLDGELGFTNGVLQIGRLYENIKNFASDNNFISYSQFVSQQAFSQNIGINCRKQLFIKNQFLKEI